MSLNTILLTGAALLPAIVLCVFIFIKDRSEKEPIWLLLLLLVLGAVSCFPAGWLEGVMQNLLFKPFIPYVKVVEEQIVWISKGAYYLYQALWAFVGVALVEELGKFVFMLIVTAKSKHFNSLFDGVIYAVFTSLGFAAYENVLYAINNGWKVALLRMLTAVPAHMFFGVIMGYYYSWWHMHRMAKKRERELKASGFITKNAKEFSGVGYIILTLLMPVLTHGFYDFCCFVAETWAALTFYGFLLFLYIFCFTKVHKMSKADTDDHSFVTAMIIKKYPSIIRVMTEHAEAAAIKQMREEGREIQSYQWPTGERYIGEWSNGVMEGKGTMLYAGGARYIGSFVGGMRHGEGTYYYVDGKRYEGQWADGMMHGQGVFYWSEQKFVKAEWANGQKVRDIE